MEFAFTDEQAMIAETVQAFFRENATSERTRAAMEGDGLDRELWTSFCTELGLAGIGLPEDFGGAGLGMVEFAIVAEAAGSQVAALPLLGHVMTGRAIAAGGSDEQKAEWLPRIAMGEVVSTVAYALEEPAVDGDKLTATLQFVPHGGIADVMFVASKAGAWLVDLKGEGVTVTTHVTMDQTRPLATVTLVGAAAQALPEVKAAHAAAWSAGWICLAAESLGGAQETLDRTVAYSMERVQFGRLIGSYQAYKHRLADMMVDIEQSRSAVYWAACAVDEESDEAALALYAAKSFCADTYFMCAGNMIQLHGGIGFTWEHDAHLFFKRARSILSMQGNGDWHRERVATLIMGEAA